MRIAAIALGCTVFASACASSRPEETPSGGAAPATEEAGGTTPTPSTGATGQAGGGQEQADEGRYLEQQWDDLTLAEKKRAFVVEEHISLARESIERLELEKAELELARALQLDPDNLEAKNLLDQVGALLGRPAGERQAAIRSLEEVHRLKLQQAEADAQDHLNRARLARSRGDYETAIVELTLCLDIVSLSPYGGDWSEIESEARSLLETVQEERETAEATRREEEQRRVLSDLQAQEQAERDRRRQVIADLLDQAIHAFRVGEYDEAIAYAERVLRLDPRNERASDIRDTAFRAGRESTQEEFLRKKRENYARWQQELDELRVPYQGVITLPDEDFWRDITARRARRHRSETQ